jgi:hemerythrin-like domain-containing protein
MNQPPSAENPDFNDPLAVMRADHAHILEHCGIVEKLVPHIAEKGVDGEARSSIAQVLNFFATVALRHQQDKEQNLFPLLNRQSLKLADIVYRLKREQDDLDNMWVAIQGALKTPATLKDNEAFSTQAEKFCNGYRRHLAYEEKELLGLAQHILSQRQLEELGDAMAKRRGVRR